jgi:DNA repair protein RecO (recombination protein O)
VDVMIHHGRSLDIITQAEVIRAYGTPLAADYPRYTAGTAMLETAERFTPEEKEPAIRQFLLLIGGLRALNETKETEEPEEPEKTEVTEGLVEAGETAEANEPTEPREPRLVLDAYFLRSLSFAGYAPALERCARCGTNTRLTAWAVAAGGMVCADCRPPGAASPAQETVALMIALLKGDWDAASRSQHRHRVECSGLVAAYLQWHLEHSIRSLRHVERA